MKVDFLKYPLNSRMWVRCWHFDYTAASLPRFCPVLIDWSFLGKVDAADDVNIIRIR